MDTHSYLLHGLRVSISAEAAILAALKLRLARFPQANPSAPADLQFEFRQLAPDAAPAFFEPAGPNRVVLELRSGEARYYEASRQFVLGFPGHAGAICDTRNGHAQIFYPEAEAGNIAVLAYPLFTIPLAELLKPHGLYMVHAAGVSLDGKGLLIAGASGAGKTTLTIALLRAGFDLLGDDTTFLRCQPDGLRALAFPDEIGVTADTARFFPELEIGLPPTATTTRRKQSFSPENVFNSKLIWDCAPVVLLFPQAAKARDSTLAPMTHEAAFLELICNVVRTDVTSAQAHLAALATLVNQCQCYRLHTGRDFDALPVRLRSLLLQSAVV